MTQSQIRMISQPAAKPSARLTRLLVSSALCGAAMLPQPSLAGTLPGIPSAANITVSAGGSQPLITFPDAITLQIELNAPRTVINWSSLHVSSGDAMNFIFDAASDIVLNKTTSQIAIDSGGIVTGTVGAATGGNIWFYSPQGVIVSPGATMTAGGFVFSRGTSLSDVSFVSAADPLANLRAATDALIRITTISSATSASINSSGDVVLSASSGALNVSTVEGNTAQVSTTSGSITISEMIATGGAAVVTAGGPGATVTSITGATGVTVSSNNNTSVGSATTTGSGDINISSNGSASLTLGNSGRDLTLSAPQVFMSTVDAVRDVFVTGTTSAFVTNRIFAGDDIEITADGDVSAGGAYLKSTGVGAVDDAHIILSSATGSVNASNTLLTQGTGVAAGDITISAATTATAGTLNSSRDVQVTGVTASLASGTAARDLFVTATTGGATVSNQAFAGDDVEITATGNIQASGATLRSTGIGATDDAHVLARSTVGAVAVGTAQTQGTGLAAGDVTVSAATNATLGSASSSRDLVWAGSSGLDLTGTYSAVRNASLTTSGTISQASGSLTAGTLSAAAQNGISLGQISNNVTSLGAINSGLGNFTYSDADDFALTGSTIGQTVTLTSAAGAITQTGGSLTATTLTASAANGISLTRAGNGLNIVAGLSNSGSGDISLHSIYSMVVAGDITTPGGVSLSSGGTITQTGGLITAGSLSAQAGAVLNLSAANLIDSLGSISAVGGGVTIVNAKALAITDTVSAANGVFIQTTAGALSMTSGGQVVANVDATLVGAGGFSGELGSVSGTNVSITAATGDALVGHITTLGGNAAVEALAGAASLRDVTGSGGTVEVNASGTATLGADNIAGITAANRAIHTGPVSVTSSNGDARVFLDSLNANLTSVSANTSTGTASVGVAGGFAVGSVSGHNIVLSASAGTIDAFSIAVAGGDYTATAQDWAGVTLSPGGTIQNLSITDTLGDFDFSGNDFHYSNNITIAALDGSVIGGDVTSDNGSILIDGFGGQLGALTAANGSVEAVASVDSMNVASATALDRIEVSGAAGAALSAATLTGTGANSLQITSSGGNVVLGAAAPGAIAASHFVTSAGTSTTVQAVAGAGQVDVNLDHTTNAELSLVDGRDGVRVKVLNGSQSIGHARSTGGGVRIEGPSGALVVDQLTAQQDSEVLGGGDTRIVSATAATDLSVESATGNLRFGNATPGHVIEVAGVLSLDAAGNIAQDAIVEAATLNATAGTGITLLSANRVQHLGLIDVGSGGFAFKGTGSYDLTDNISAAGQVVDLRSTGAIDQAAGTITAQSLTGQTVGGANFAGANAIAQLDDFANAGGLLLLNDAAALTIVGTVSSSDRLVIRSHGGMTFASTGTVRADGAGDAVTLASDGVFTNGRGVDAVTAGNAAGRWLIYTQAAGDPTGSTSGDQFGGLAGKSFYGSAYDFTTGLFSAAPNAGNRFVHAYRPVLTVNPVTMTVTYNGTVPTPNWTIAGLVNGDLAADAWTGAPIFTGGGKNAGNYVLTAAAGTLASDLNYAFAFGTSTLRIDPRALTVTAFDAFKAVGQADPSLLYSITSGELVSGDAFTGALTRSPGEAPGDYRIGRGTLSLSPNYVLTFNGATFTIRPVPTNDPAGSALLKALPRSLDFNLNWDPAASLTTTSEDCASAGCPS